MNHDYVSEEPLLRYSADCERASFLDDDDDKETDGSMPKKKGSKKKAKKTKRRSGTTKTAKGVKFSKGKVSIRLGGLGLKKLGASELVRHISLSKLKIAAKKFLQSKGQLPKKRRKGRKKKD
jgi:hypothetical protein